MTFPIWLGNLISYSLQIAVLVSAGSLLALAFRLRLPRVALLYWQALLLACLLLPALQSWRRPQFEAFTTTGLIAYDLADTTAAVRDARSKVRVPEAIGLILGAGVCLRLVWLAAGFLRLKRYMRRSESLPSPPDVAGSLPGRGIRVRFFLCREIDSPATFGIFSPIILLPQSFPSMSEACRNAVLCHELLHVRRRDWAIILLEEIVRSIFWFHPAVWWLLGRIHLAREQSVDYEVVRLTGGRQPYLDSLLEIARAHGRPKAVPAPLFLKERHLVQRVALLLKEVSMNRFRVAFSLAAAAVLLTGTGRIASGWFPLTGTPDITEKQIAVHEVEILPETPAVAGAPVTVEITASAPVRSPEPAAAPPAAVPQRAPLKVNGDVQESKLIRRVEPIYPKLAMRARVQGKVILAVKVDEEGIVSDVTVVSGHPMLNEAAVTAVKQWKYSPTLLNGVPVPVLATVTVVFRLKGGDTEMESLSDAEKWIGSQRMAAATGLTVRGPGFHLSYKAAPINEKGPLSPDMRVFRAPELPVLSADNFSRWQEIVRAGWPDDVARQTPLAYSLIVDETGQITNFARIQGPEIPELERELSQARAVSPGMREAAPVRTYCVLEISIDASDQ